METIVPFHKGPKLTLVGAGPGDPELITVKAINTLKAADIVLYDALVSAEILQLIPETTPAISVGKRAGGHSCTQNEINEMIVEFAYLYGHVVRLKGGDPFVFGRGAEEIEFAAKHGIATAIVPGISSAVAVPASINIPVTARGISESVWVVTGTTMTGVVSEDVALAARSSATVVILMGLNKLEEIMEIFCYHGKSKTPVAVVQNGTMKEEKSVVATVSTIAQLAKQENIGSPAVIIVGEVVKYAAVLESLSFQAHNRLSTFQ
jgi:uroporphyrin-III C-methyltransferase